MIISHRHRFIFFKPFKTGGTTVEQSIRRLPGLGRQDVYTGLSKLTKKGLKQSIDAQNHLKRNVAPRRGERHVNSSLILSFYKLVEHETPGKIEKLFPEAFKNYKCYSMTRNPFDTMVSYFWSLYNNPHSNPKLRIEKEESFETTKKKFKLFLTTPKKWRSQMLNTQSKGELKKILPSDAVAIINEEMSCIENIIKFENIEKGLRDYFSYDGSFELPKFNSGFRTSEMPYQEYYEGSKDLVEIIEKSFPNTLKVHKYKL